MKKSNYFFGIGTLGRDMVYALTAMYLMYYLTDVRQLSSKGIGIVTIIMMVLRIFDAVNDPFCGMMIDNTKCRFGKFKPWLFWGSISSALLTILLFVDYTVSEAVYLMIFTLVYLMWDITYTAHDIAFWSMIPALSSDGREREKIGSIAKICADIGIFTIVVGIIPFTKWLNGSLGGMKQAYFVLSVIVSLVMVGFIMLMLILVKEERTIVKTQETTEIKEILSVIVKNDQLLWIVISLLLFTIANTTTTSFGIYYFQYIMGDEDLYSVFAGVLALSQLAALGSFPMISQRLGRKKTYALGTVLVVLGYLLFFMAQEIISVSIAGVLVFFGEGFIQILMLMFISDCVEYGQWKLGRRNDSITLSLQPFIAKMGSALAAGVVGFTILLIELNKAQGPADLSSQDVMVFKIAMLILPMLVILLSYVIYHKKYKINGAFFRQIVEDLESSR
ncbi:glycoside-pentoside-hexuronide (GPH):cation symporter [Streptococcus suis]|uniref:glycoside-pentoside-hexuronide (GPH):cation symporter n=1 Tax=Streptococcus suis TaxID=1307 RepID=UPI0014791D5B